MADKKQSMNEKLTGAFPFLNKKQGKIKLPTKRTVNLATVGQKKINYVAATIAFIVIIVAAVLVSKFAVVDRFMEVSRAQAEVSDLQRQLQGYYDRIAGYKELVDLYGHYTYAGMTDEEMSRADRIVAIEMILKIIDEEEGDATLGALSVVNNTIVANVTGQSLQHINLITQSIEKEDNVDFCMVTYASTDYMKTEYVGDVTAKITIYLKDALKGDEIK